MKPPRYLQRYTYFETNIHQIRTSILVGMILIGSLILILRLAYLQFSQYKRYATLSLKNQMSILPVAPPRGIIVDRNGVILADNTPIYVLEVTPEHVHHVAATLKKLQRLLPSISDDDLDNYYREGRQYHIYEPIPLKINLTQEEVAIFASNQYLFPGISIKARLMRNYPLKETTAHVLGYVGRINVQELRKFDTANYRGTNFVGKSGIEKYYEDLLHGQVGYQQVETDASGRTLRILRKQAPQSGAKLYLTIDSRLQKIAYDAFQQKNGAAVVLNVKNGEVLTLVSAPSFNPNLFVNGIRQQDYQKLAQSPDRPLYNRAVRGLYPPASTIKPYIALAGLEKGVVNLNTHIYDPGWYKLPGIQHAFRDWKHGGHGTLNIARAITVSCDTYFYQLGNKLGIANIEDMLMKFGFGQLTHIDLEEETQGVLPSPHWKRQAKGLNWYPGDTLITSIGQGFMLATPLQLANATASLSQYGRRYRPHLLHKQSADHGLARDNTPVEEYPLHLSNQDAWDVVIDAMYDVISSEEGTGYRFGRDAPYSVAAKTGTAQVFSIAQNKKASDLKIPEGLRDHSLFIAFAPVDDPQIAVAVVVEHDVIAAQLARVIMDAYFQLYPLPADDPS